MSETTELTWTPARENLGLHKPVDVEIRGTGLELVLRFASRLPEPPGAQRALLPPSAMAEPLRLAIVFALGDDPTIARFAALQSQLAAFRAELATAEREAAVVEGQRAELLANPIPGGAQQLAALDRHQALTTLTYLRQTLTKAEAALDQARVAALQTVQRLITTRKSEMYQSLKARLAQTTDAILAKIHDSLTPLLQAHQATRAVLSMFAGDDDAGRLLDAAIATATPATAPPAAESPATGASAAQDVPESVTA